MMTIDRAVFDSRIKTPEHRLVWTWALVKPNKYSDVVSDSTAWLKANMGPLPYRYRLSGVSAKCIKLEWDEEENGYAPIATTADSIEFANCWNPLVARVYRMFPGVDGNVRYITYDVSDGWERWVLIRQYDSLVMSSTTVMIAFDDELMALQCKLALS